MIRQAIIVGLVVTCCASLALLAFVAADRNVLMHADSAYRQYGEAQGWRWRVNIPARPAWREALGNLADAHEAIADWWVETEQSQYSTERKAMVLTSSGVCRRVGFHQETPEGDYIIEGWACGWPIGSVTVTRGEMSCQPGARDWPTDQRQADQAADRVCATMAAFVGDHSAPFAARAVIMRPGQLIRMPT
jgi:hypothetical protein